MYPTFNSPMLNFRNCYSNNYSVYRMMFCVILMLHFLNWTKGISCSLANHGESTKNHTVDLSRCHLTDIPQNIPIDTEILDLSYNDIQIIPNDIFTNLSRVVTLDLSNNQINAIGTNSFKGLSRIQSLNLQGNNLTCISLQVGSFQKLISLTTLDISTNPDYDVLSIAFSDELYKLQNLSTLYLDGIETNQSQFNKFECFKKLNNLTIITKYGISLTNTTFAGFQNLPIQKLSIINVKSTQNNAFSFFPRLQTLILTLSWRAVSLEKIFPVLEVFKGRRMQTISLRGNLMVNFFRLGESHLRYLWDICLKELHLPSNYIVDIDASSFSIFATKSTCLEVFDMSDNPLATNNVYWWDLIAIFKKLKCVRFSHIGFCTSSDSSLEKFTHTNITFLLPPTLQEISINYGSSARGLPNVTFNNGQSMKKLSLFQMKFQDCLGSFGGLPNLTELDISGFNCTFVNPNILQSLPQLEIFTAQNINLNFGLTIVRESGARLFRNLSNLYYVDISVNNLESLHSDMFKDQQETLSHLNLSTNAFKSIPISMGKFKSLEILDLTSNKIAFIDDDEQKLFETNNNIDLRLSGNPFACTCNHRKFLRWIKDRGMKFFMNVECIDGEGIAHNVSEVIGRLDNFELKCVVTFWLYFAIIMLSSCGLLVFFFAIYYRYQSEIQYFFLKLKIQMKKYNALKEDNEYQFDAFISYSSSDSPWVTQFYRQLTDNGFKLCIDAKDFIVGDGIAENIVKSIDCSRKIIFIVTRNFLKSSWGGYEIEMTRMHAFREGRENMVILIIKDEIPIDEMPRTLKEMWDKIVCLKYYDESEPNFYDSVALCLR